MTRKGQDALRRADALIAEILTLLSTVTMEPDTQAALEIELLSLRIQVEIARTESEIYERQLTRGRC